VVLQSAEGGFFCKSNEKSATVDWSMRRLAPPLLAASAALFFAWEVYAVIRWVHDAGGRRRPGCSLDRHDALGWLVRERALLAIAFVLLGSPALLVYLAWRMGAGGRSITG
jgi:hypothetical protein